MEIEDVEDPILLKGEKRKQYVAAICGEFSLFFFYCIIFRNWRKL